MKITIIIVRVFDPEMTDNVSGGTLNLTQSIVNCQSQFNNTFTSITQ